MTTHWRNQPERGSLWLIRLILWIALNLGRRVSRLCLYPITAYFLLAATNARRSSRRYLQRVLSEPVGWRHMARHFHCFSATILDRVFFLSDNIDQFDIRFHNHELLLERAKAGNGCLLFGSHLGSFEVLRAMAKLDNFPLKVLMYQDQNEKITRVLDELNPKIADAVIPLGHSNAMLQANEFVQQGGILGILSDRAGTDSKVTECEFFGSDTRFPAGPAILAAAMSVPVVLVFGLYRGGNRYDVHFELLADKVTLPRAQRKQEIQKLMQTYAQHLETYTRRAPYNWFNFYDFWATENE